MKNNIILGFLVVIASFFINSIMYVSPSFADTDIFATTTTSTLWTKANSPYIIHSPLAVLPGEVLTILPGTVVKFQVGKGLLNIEGKLVAMGTATDTIQFTSSRDGQGTTTPKTGDWQGILFNGTLPSQLSYADIRYADRGISFFNQQNTTLSHSTFDFTNEAVAAFGGSSIKADNIISEHSATQGAVDLYEGSSLELKDSKIENGTGQYGLVAYESSTTLSNVLIDGNNGGSGVALYGSALTLSSTTISHFQTGLLSYDDTNLFSSATATRSHIEYNTIGIKSYGGSIIASQNTIAFNSQFGAEHFGSNLIDLRNNYWGHATGPSHASLNPPGQGNAVSDTISFLPFLDHEPVDATTSICCSNILFIPGIETSRLYSTSTFGIKQLWEPLYSSLVKGLFLDKTGHSVDPTIYTKDIIGNAKFLGIQVPGEDVYSQFISSLDGMVTSGKIADWKAVPYDWRLDLNETIKNGVKYPNGSIVKVIDQLRTEASSSKTKKVTLITHSNGGLVAKLLLYTLEQMQKDQGDTLIDSIDKVVMVAVPQVGTPVAIAGLLHGDEQSLGYGITLNSQTARQLGENMPSAYALLPSAGYFNLTDNAVVTFDSGAQKLNSFSKYGSKITDRDTLDAFLSALRDTRTKPSTSDIDNPNILNKDLLVNSEQLHSLIDTVIVPDTIKVYKITGIGMDTLNQINYSTSTDCTLMLFNCHTILTRNLGTTLLGDGTVVGKSASYGSGDNYYVDLAQKTTDQGRQYVHQNILEIPELESFISNLVAGDTTLPKYISTTTPSTGTITELHIGVHSPVSLDLYDKFGNHTGLSNTVSSTDEFLFVDNQIPGSTYVQVGEEKYITVPADNTYAIKLKGLDTGTFSLTLDKTVGGNTVATTSFEDIPVSIATQATTTIQSTIGSTTLAVDIDGDGKTDLSLQPSTSFDPITYLQILKSTVLSLGLKSRIKDELIMKIDTYIDQIKKGKIKKTDSSIRLFIKRLGQSKHWYKGLVGADRELIANLIKSILDSLQT